MSDDLKNPITNKLRQQKRAEYQELVRREIESNFSDAEQRALQVKCMVLLVEEFLPEDVKNELFALHLAHKKYNHPELEDLVA